MCKKQVIQKEYMSVGELAKQMGISVRTLQYYDQEGLLSPSGESKGRRRMYTYKDMILLHQILSLKSLGFSLKDIKNKLISLDTPEDVANILTKQANEMQEKIEQLTETYKAIEVLKKEVLQMQSVDFKTYADIIKNLQMHNEYYWLIKHFDEDMLDHIRMQFNMSTGQAFMKRFNVLSDAILQLEERRVTPQDECAQLLAEQFWNLVMEFTNGNMQILSKIMHFEEYMHGDDEWIKKQARVQAYMEPVLEIYFERMQIHPFMEETI